MKKRAVVSLTIPFSASRRPGAAEGPLAADSATKHRYMQALEQELCGALSLLDDYRVAAVRVCGGSPSTVRPDDVAHLLRLARARLDLERPFSIEMQALPQTVGTPSMGGMKGGGVTCVCLRVPSVVDAELAALGCAFDFDDVQNALAFIGRFGIPELEVQTMYGIPGQNGRSLAHTLKAILSCEPDRVRLERCPSIAPTGEKDVAGGSDRPDSGDGQPGASNSQPDATDCLRKTARSLLEGAGYRPSADGCFALPGREPAYEAALAAGCDVFGFGLGASSVMDGVRCTVTDSLPTYLEHAGSYDQIVAKVERLEKTA